MASSALQVLHSIFGYSSFRGEQQAIIEHVVGGGDALVLMPTGGGKSLCYQIPALIRGGTAVVISPLIALMQDQVDALRQVGVDAAFLNSSLDALAQRDVEQRFAAGALKLLYVAPERLLTERCLEMLSRASVSLFAIDEAHCVSQWGHDFRPEYRQLTVLHERFPKVPRIALTATADAPTRREIVERLALGAAREFVASFDRPNICYRVVEKDEARRQLQGFPRNARRRIRHRLLPVATQGRRHRRMARQGRHRGAAVSRGHGCGVSHANQQRFLREDGIVIVATIAFGMGIDIADAEQKMLVYQIQDSPPRCCCCWWWRW